jgi:MinD superfamily P-loop ATPase
VIELVQSFDIPLYAVINKYDIHPGMSQQIERSLEDHQVMLLGKIPYDEAAVKAMVRGQSIHEYDPLSIASGTIASIWEHLFPET